MKSTPKKGNMYEWIDETWNPLAGQCPHNCLYCSTHKLMRYPVIKQKYSGEPRIDTKALNKKLKKNKVIFVCGQNDLFAEGISDFIIKAILQKCKEYNNTYLFQTKNTQRLLNFMDYLPLNYILCTTIETNRWYPEIMNNSPHPKERAKYMNLVSDHLLHQYITIEPIMDFDLIELVEMIEICYPSQVNIGADSGNNNLPEPSKEKILELIDKLKTFTNVKLKSNLNRLLK